MARRIAEEKHSPQSAQSAQSFFWKKCFSLRALRALRLI
jgi:hypothetical protein